MSIKMLVVIVINLVVFTFVVSTTVPQSFKVERAVRQRVGAIKEGAILEKGKYYTADELINLLYVKSEVAIKYNGVIWNSSSNYVDMKKELGTFSYKVIDISPDFVEVIR